MSDENSVGQTQWKRMVLMPEDVAGYERDPEAFALRRFGLSSVRLDNIICETTPDGLTSLTIEYTPLLPHPANAH